MLLVWPDMAREVVRVFSMGTTVAEVMTSEVVTIRSSARVAAAIALMQQRSIQALIVEKMNDSDAYGIVTAGDIVAKVIAFGKDPKTIRVFEIMTKPCVVLNPNLEIEYAARLLSQYHLHSAPVIQTKLLGLLSITDFLACSNVEQRPQALTQLSRRLRRRGRFVLSQAPVLLNVRMLGQ